MRLSLLLFFGFAALLSLSACRGSSTALSGMVTVDGAADSSGTRVALTGPTSGTAVTASDGSYRFDDLVTGGHYAVVASADGTRESSLGASALTSDRQFPPLVFHAVGSLGGRVTRAGAQSGNAGILVSAQGSSGATLSDDSGNFEIDGLAPGDYDLDALTDGYLPGGASAITVTRGGHATAPEIDLSPAPTGPPAPADLRGIATVAGVTAGTAGIRVTLETGAPSPASTVTLADGSYVLTSPPPGTVSLAFDDGPYHEVVPQVLTLPGASGFYLGSQLYPLDGTTLILPRGRRIESDALVDELQLSPGGDYVVWRVGTNVDNTSADGTLMAAALSDGGFGSPTVVGQGVPPGWSFSPDDKLLAYATADAAAGTGAYDIRTWPLAGGASALLVTDMGLDQYQFVGGGSSVLIKNTLPSPWSLVPALGGAVTPLTQSVLSVSPAGDQLLGFGNCVASLCDLVRLPVTGGAATTVLTGLAPTAVQVSPGWDHAAIAGSGQLRVVDLSANAVATFAGTSLLYFTPDGNRIVYLDGSGNLTSAPSAGGAAETLATAGNFSSSAISPGGTRVYFLGPTAVARVPVAGGAIETLTGQTSFQFSPQGRWVELYSGGDGAYPISYALSVGPAEGGAVVPIASAVPELSYPYLRSTVVFDGGEARVAYLTIDGPSTESASVAVTALDSVAPTRLASGAVGFRGFSPDGTTVLYFTAEHFATLYAVAADGSSPAVGLLAQVYQARAPVLGEQTQFVGDGQVVSMCRYTPAPLDFQNGLYLLSLPGGSH